MNKIIAGAVFSALLAGSAIGYWLQPGPGSSPAMQQATASRPLFYRNPMNPAITSPVPAQDEMGMDYIPVYADGDAPEIAGTVQIDPVTRQNMGVRTARVDLGVLSRLIRTSGRVVYDETRVTRLHPKVEGWVNKLFVDVTGSRVEKDTMLLALYSPQLVVSEEEYLLALHHVEAVEQSPVAQIRQGAESLADASLERLQLLDVPEHQLRELRKTRKVIRDLHIHSPFDGVVTAIGAREGQWVTPATELYTIADLDRVWVYADLYEDDLPWVKVGDVVDIQVSGIPEQVFHGRVAYVYPYLDAATRTNRVRIECDNAGHVLKPEMFASVRIHADRQLQTLLIPESSLVRSGTDTQVFVAHGDGHFEPRSVQTGVIADGRVQILHGLSEGEEVVSSAAFLIDSESRLNEATAKMLEPGKVQDTGMENMKTSMGGEMEMDDMSMDGMQMPMEHSHDHP